MQWATTPREATAGSQMPRRALRQSALSRRHDLEVGADLYDSVVCRLLNAYEFRQRAYRSWTVAAALVVGLTMQLVAARTAAPELRLGVGGSPWGNVILLVTSGALVGSIAAEMHNFRRKRRGEQTAGLEVRAYAYYARRDLRAGLWGVTVAVVAVSLVNASSGVDVARSVLPVVAALITAAVVEIAGRRVANRRRPWLRPPVRRADDVLRRSAINRSLLARGIALNLLVLSFALVEAAAGRPGSPGLSVATASATGTFVGALLVVYRSHRWTLTPTQPSRAPT